MAREKVGSDVMQVRFPDGTFARMDERFGKGGRAEFIRDAVLRTLNGLDGDFPVDRKDAVIGNPISKPSEAKRPERQKAAQIIPENIPKRVVRPGRDPDRWSVQKSALLTKLRDRPMDERTAARELGWSDGLVSRVATELSREGLIRFERGLMVAGA